MNFETSLILHNLRQSYSVPSHHHQTLLSKAVFEHVVKLPTIAAVALSSKSIQNSSLAANCAFNFQIDKTTILLFECVFEPSSALPVQFVPELHLNAAVFDCFDNPNYQAVDASNAKIRSWFSSLKNSTKYFRHSLRSLTIEKCKDLRKFIQELFGCSANELPDPEEINRDTTTPEDGCFPNLQNIKLRQYHSSDDDASLLQDKSVFPALKYVGITAGRNVNGTDMEAYSKWAPLLAELDVSYSALLSDEEISLLVPKFQLGETNCSSSSSSLSPSSLLPVLRKLDLSLCHSFSNLGTIVAAAPRLEELHLYGCEAVDDSTLAQIATSCSDTLTTLHIAGCKKCTDVGLESSVAALSNLTCLSLGSDLFTDSGIEKVTASLAQLTSLAIDGANITETGMICVVSRLHRLNTLYIGPTAITGACFENLDKKLQRLQFLNVDRCLKLGVEGFRGIMKMKTLLRLGLNDCDGVSMECVDQVIRELTGNGGVMLPNLGEFFLSFGGSPNDNRTVRMKEAMTHTRFD